MKIWPPVIPQRLLFQAPAPALGISSPLRNIFDDRRRTERYVGGRRFCEELMPISGMQVV